LKPVLFERNDENSDAYIISNGNHIQKDALEDQPGPTAEAGSGFFGPREGHVGFPGRSGEVAYERIQADYRNDSDLVTGFSDSVSITKSRGTAPE
jgi:hypothetical protein